MFGTKKDAMRPLIPADEFEGLGRRLDKWVDSVFSGWPAVTDSTLRRLTGPTLDVEDKGGSYLVKADVPGVRKEDLKVTLNGSVLVIEGKRESEKQEEDAKKGYWRSERFFGEFRRVVDLPGEVDKDKAQAAYADGVLTLTLPKAPTKPQADGKIKVP